MKKNILSAAAVIAFAFNAQAQEVAPTTGFSEGDVFMTGSVGFGTTKTGDFKTDQFTISPKAGYFVTSNIAIGAQIGYTSATTTVETFTGFADQDTNSFAVGAFGRYYFTPARNFSFFGQLGVDYVTTKTETEGVPGESKNNGFNIGLAPGVSYFVSEHIAFEATFGILGYNTTKPDVDGAESTDSFNIGLDFTNIQFGMVYKF